jgi:site-specific DNA recombinase
MQANIFGSSLDDLTCYAPAAASRLGKLGIRQLSVALKSLVTRVEVAEDCVRVVTRALALAKFIGWDGVGFFKLSDLELARASRLQALVIPVAMLRQRRTSWLPIEKKNSCGCPDTRLVQLIKEARSAHELLFSERDKSVHEIARLARRRVGSFSRLVRLNYLAPDILTAIVDGTQPPTLTRRRLIECDLPIDWELQRRLLGFPPKQRMAVLARSDS